MSRLLRPQVLEETEHFHRWRQEKVAKIVQCGEPKFLGKQERRPPVRVAFKYFVTWFVT
jgi:hypothetical protein